MRLEYKISVVKKNPSRENLNYRRRVKNSSQYGVIPSSISEKVRTTLPMEIGAKSEKD